MLGRVVIRSQSFMAFHFHNSHRWFWTPDVDWCCQWYSPYSYLTHFHPCRENPLEEYGFFFVKEQTHFTPWLKWSTIWFCHVWSFYWKKGDEWLLPASQLTEFYCLDCFSFTLSNSRFEGLCREHKVIPSESCKRPQSSDSLQPRQLNPSTNLQLKRR